VAGLKPKIVVIDDNEVVLEFTKNALEGAGYEVVTHDRSTGCVALILHEKPELALIDVNLPGLAGDTVVTVLSKAAPNSETVVLLHSSLPAEVLKTKASLAGAHGFIHKSGDSFGLVREVNRWLKRVNSSGHMRAAPLNEDTFPSGTRLAVASVGSGAPRVLLVDGDMGVLSGYRRTLQAENIAIEFALSGAQAQRRLLSDAPPHVIVSDLLLPDISGVELYQSALAVEPSYRQRFVVATGTSGAPAVTAFLASFSGPVLFKPVSVEKLNATVRSCLSGARRFLNAGVRSG
jgi:DNA-binding NarL/FixJ family response regulator